MQIRNTTPRQNFTSLFRFSSYKDCYGRRRETQNTTAIRDDLNYTQLAKVAKQRFAKFDKIKVMPMNGSDGTEAYFIADAFLRVFGEKEAKKKVFPILVTDIDSFIIDNFGKKGIVSFTPDEIEAFGKNFNKYFEEIPMQELPQIPNAYSVRAKAFKLTPFFKELFQFQQADFQLRLRLTKDKGNSIIIIRNCLAQAFGWPETGLIEHQVLDTLKGGSLFVIGGYDRWRLPDMVPTLKNFGAKEVITNVFSKVKTPLDEIYFNAQKFINKIKYHKHFIK